MSAVLRLGIGLALIGAVLWLGGGAGEVMAVLAAGGGAAVATLVAFHVFPVGLCGIAWSIPMADGPRGRWKIFVLARWIRDAINQILPLVPLGGEVLGARVATNRGLPGPQVAAVTVVDVTAELLSQVAFCLLGVAFWLVLHPTGGLPPWMWAGVLVMVPMGVGFLVAQKMGLMRMLERIADKVMPDAWRRPEESRSIHDLLIALYNHRGRFLAATVVHLAAWLAATVGVWAALHVIDHPLPWGDVVTLESMVYAARAAAFVVPAALGVQEGAYVLLGTALGLPPDVALALALIKRGREISLGLPAVLTWQLLGRRTNPRSGS